MVGSCLLPSLRFGAHILAPLVITITTLPRAPYRERGPTLGTRVSTSLDTDQRSQKRPNGSCPVGCPCGGTAKSLFVPYGYVRITLRLFFLSLARFRCDGIPMARSKADTAGDGIQLARSRAEAQRTGWLPPNVA